MPLDTPAPSGLTAPPSGVIQALYTRFGLVPTGAQLGRIARALAELQQAWFPRDPAAMERAVLDSPFSGIRPLVAAATINESYFFRDARQMSVLREDILPGLIRRRRQSGDRRLVVWSAAAAAGQELHTIAILLHDLLADLPDWSLELIGTDIDADNLDRADAGLYSARDLRATPPDVQQRHFTAEGRGYRLSPKIHGMTRFITASITDPVAAAALGRVDLVLCRNVLIYFDPDSIARAMRNMTARLSADGYLVLGHAEVFSDPPADLALDTSRGVFFYRPVSCPPAALSRPPAARTAAAAGHAAPGLVTTGHEATPEPVAPAQRPRLQAPARPDPPAATTTAEVGPTEEPQDLAALLVSESWPEILEAVERGPASVEARCYRVRALSALGREHEATAALVDLIGDCADQAIVHYLAAILAVDSGDAQAAAASLRRALYLRRDFPEAEFHFGLVLEGLGHSGQARAHFARAARLLAEADPDEPVLFDPDLRYGSLVAWLQAASSQAPAGAAPGSEST